MVAVTNPTAKPTLQPAPLLEINYVGLGLVFLTPALGGFLYGFDIGATSFVLAMLLQTDDERLWWSTFPKFQQGLFVSALSLGALMGSHLVLMHLSHIVGRRTEIRICSILYIFGTFLNVLSGTTLAETSNHWWGGVGFYSLFLGRLLFGVGVGFIMHGAPTYMAEMCPPQIRGAVVSAKETVIVGGIVVGYAAGNFMSSDPRNWTDLYGASVFVAIPMLLLTFRIPRSKRWLLMHGLRQEALESMQFVYKGDVRSEFTSMVTSIDLSRSVSMSNEDGTSSRGPSLFSNDYRKAMVASMGLIIFQQFSGQPSVLSYATVLFQAAGWSGNASVVAAVLMMFMSMSTVVLVDKLGRKRMLCFCCIVMMTALSALSTCFWDWNEQVEVELPTIQKLAILVGMFVYIGGFQLGFGPITWTIVSEVFPLEIRGRAIAFGVELNYLLNFLVQFGFPIILETLGWGRTFSLFATILAFAFFFIREFVPETTGLTLEEIQTQLNGDRDGADIYVSPEETRLLPKNSPLLGLAPNLEEMESELERRDSDRAITEKASSGFDV